MPRASRDGEAETEAAGLAAAAGSVNVTRVPRPGPALSARMRPPCASTSPLQMTSPRAGAAALAPVDARVPAEQVGQPLRRNALARVGYGDLDLFSVVHRHHPDRAPGAQGPAGAPAGEFLPELSFWQVSLSLFGEPECDYWPQPQVGLALWSLSTTGDQWQDSETLMRLSVLPDEAVLRNPDWVAPVLFVLRVLRPLRWFGLVECRSEDAARRGHGVWRKTPLFDRFVRFDPNLVGIGQARCTDAASATPPGSGEHASPLSMCPPGPGAKHVAQGWAGSAELWRRCASIHAMVHRA